MCYCFRFEALLTFLVEGNESLGNGLADGVDLGYMTTTANAHADVDAGEFLLQDTELYLD